VIDTNGSSFDTVLYIYNTFCGDVSPLECDDDGGAGVSSMISRVLSPGTYWVVVDGYSSSYSGPYQLNVSITPPGVGDTCPAGIVYPWPGTDTGSTLTYMDDYSAWSCQSWSEGPDVVYELIMPSQEWVTVDTEGSAFDTVLAILDDTCTELYCDDDGGTGLLSSIYERLPAGTYYIVVDGYWGDGGAYQLNVTW
jgi:hypothetical protein